VPATAVESWPRDTFDEMDLQQVRTRLTSAGDDVWSDVFLEGLIVHCAVVRLSEQEHKY
jgi:hypothetical protein